MRPQSVESRPIASWISAIAVIGTLAALVVAERRRPLRCLMHEPKPRRNARNLAVAALAAAAIQHAERPVTSRLTALVSRRRVGFVSRLNLPETARTATACVLLDYTLYLWHVLTHRIPFLWRFHRVHHADLDMDASTAIRFHFGEILASVAWRAVQIVLIGVTPRALSIWNTLLMVEVMFHHSNVQLSHRMERRLGKVIVTPRMHGIHHSIRQAEQDSNWSSGLTLWDWLHGTLRRDVPQEQITIGVAELRDPAQVTLPKLLAMPFRQRSGAIGQAAITIKPATQETPYRVLTEDEADHQM